MSGPSDPGTGVKVFSIAGRMSDVRQRCLGMTEADRQWRAQFLKDQILSHDEPRYVPEHYKATTNFFRRLWKTPMNHLENTLQPLVGKETAYFIRHFIRIGSAFLAATYITTYFLKYHTNDWTKKLQWRYNKNVDIIYPDEPNYPYFHEKTPQEYADDGFHSSPYAILVRQSNPQSHTLRYSKKQKGTEVKKGEEETVCEK